MADDLTVITNKVPRFTLDASDLSASERAEFDYLPWDALERGEANASFVRYRGVTYDLGEFMSTSGMPEFSPLVSWDGYVSDTFFSGVVARFADASCESVVMGRFYA